MKKFIGNMLASQCAHVETKGNFKGQAHRIVMKVIERENYVDFLPRVLHKESYYFYHASY